MKRISADEFAAHAAEYLRSDEPLEVEQDGRVIGQYRPGATVQAGEDALTPSPCYAANGTAAAKLNWSVDPQKHDALEALDRLLKQIYAETGMTEDEFADLLDPKKPFPYDKVPEA